MEINNNNDDMKEWTEEVIAKDSRFDRRCLPSRSKQILKIFSETTDRVKIVEYLGDYCIKIFAAAEMCCCIFSHALFLCT